MIVDLRQEKMADSWSIEKNGGDQQYKRYVVEIGTEQYEDGKHENPEFSEFVGCEEFVFYPLRVANNPS